MKFIKKKGVAFKNMGKVITVLKYKLKILFSDKSFLIIITLIPLLLTFITGYALRFEKYNEIPIAICDNDDTDYSHMVLYGIQKRSIFKTYTVDEKQAIKLVKDNKVECAFIIKKGFKNNIITGNVTGIIDQVAHPSSVSKDIVREIVGSEVSRLILNVSAADWVVNEYINLKVLSPEDIAKKESIWNEAWLYTNSLWEPEPPMKVEFKELRQDKVYKQDTEGSENKNITAGSISFSAFGMLVAFLMFLIMFNSSWLVDEKENGTLQRLISSSGALSSLFFGNILSLLFVGAVHVVLFAAVSKIIFGIDLLLNPINILVLFLYLLCTIGISLLISSILKTRLQLQSGAPLFSIITGFIGGCFWNFSEISGIIKTVSLFTPQGLALDLFNKYGLIEAEGFSQRASILKTMILSPQALILLTVALITTLLSYELIKRLRY